MQFSSGKFFSGCFVSTLLFLFSLQAKCEFEKEVKDICHPTVEEFRMIQHCLTQVKPEELPSMKSSYCKSYFSGVKFVGDHPDEVPVFKTLYLNGDPNDKRNCIVLYATYNSPYPENVAKVIEALETIGFDGHLIYRIGGYPNVEQGSLKLITVPYAFKVAALQEAAMLGYQNILWLDSALIPLKSLEPLFDLIEEQGCFAMASGGNIQAEVNKGYINQEAFSALKISYLESRFVPHIIGGSFGINVRTLAGSQFLTRFHALAEEKTAFFSDWPDEIPLSVVFYQLKLRPTGIWVHFFAKDWESPAQEHHFFSLSRKRPAGR